MFSLVWIRPVEKIIVALLDLFRFAVIGNADFKLAGSTPKNRFKSQ